MCVGLSCKLDGTYLVLPFFFGYMDIINSFLFFIFHVKLALSPHLMEWGCG